MLAAEEKFSSRLSVRHTDDMLIQNVSSLSIAVPRMVGLSSFRITCHFFLPHIIITSPSWFIKLTLLVLIRRGLLRIIRCLLLPAMRTMTLLMVPIAAFVAMLTSS